MPNNSPHSQNQSGQDAVTVALSNLLKGQRYAWISHGTETYLLQLTKSNKLLLTK